MSFFGTYEHTMDAKGRLSLPAKYRKQLVSEDDDEVLIAPGFKRGKLCTLFVFADDAAFDAWFKRFYKTPDGGDEFDQNSDSDEGMHDYFYNNTVPVRVEDNGRVKLPQSHIDMAGLKRDVHVAGGGDHVEIWDAERHSAYLASIDPLAGRRKA